MWQHDEVPLTGALPLLPLPIVEVELECNMGWGMVREMRKWRQIVKITFLISFAGKGSNERRLSQERDGKSNMNFKSGMENIYPRDRPLEMETTERTDVAEE